MKMSQHAWCHSIAYPNDWIFTNGDKILAFPYTYVGTYALWGSPGRFTLSPTEGVLEAAPGWWLYKLPDIFRGKLNPATGKPGHAVTRTKPVREDLDPATAKLVYSRVPAYRNSDRCPKPGCGRIGYFKQMALCCDVHGAFHA